MIKRPLSQQFTDKVLTGVKVCTIRDKPWPLNRPIMFYYWPGRAYAKGSKHCDVAVIEVTARHILPIHHYPSGAITYGYLEEPRQGDQLLWKLEGFESQEAMNEWFRKVVPPDKLVTKWLHQFRLIRPS